ncbi:MAG TPA: EamA family transporter [Casimicrobiaceae bacterium]|nr:EamA family transporter [Casimicrobiaceae bacterium]
MSSARLTLRDLTLLLAVVALWGFAFVPIKVALETVPPFALAALRFFFAGLPAVFFIRRPRVALRSLIGYGVAIGICQFGLLFLGMRLGMPAGLSSLVIQTQVFFTMALGAWWMHDRLGMHNLGGAVIAAIGMVLLGTHKVNEGASATLIGFLLVVASAIGWAVGNIMAKRMMKGQDDEMLGLVVWSSLVPPLPLALLSYLVEGGPAAAQAVVHMDALRWGCVLLLSYGATLFGYVTWNRMLLRYPTPLVSPFGLLIPVSGLASGVLLAGERLAPLQIAGAALVLAGLAWNVYAPRLLRAR